ncbi:hypothetical protein WSS_A40595 [Rhodococcus opacus M213]|uniref:Chemotaxis protein n=1 Tax=Rhodococcus opacus M213 TaxID=1129896 RepID=K8X7R4_RHOOP|nr:hypothetical protein [Rhodococcus opacus]EKT76856.1 hypothetical protein WSS_A40595 [Rhodococcus opacus M213]
MVLPLIPVALIAVGALTGGGGVALGGKGAYDIKRAAGQIRDARDRYDRRYAEIEECVETTNTRIVALGEQQKQALSDVVLRLVEFLKRNEKKIRESEKLIADGVDFSQAQISEEHKLAVDVFSWVGGAAASAALATGTSAAVVAAAGSVGVASTGSAISGLSGVAATNATMAWLGGGALSAGGGGMAMGAAALNFVTIGPALLVGGSVISGQGRKALTQAKQAEAEIAVAIAELDVTETRLAAVRTRADELSSLLSRLTTQAIGALDVLELEPFEPHAHAPRLQKAFQLAKAGGDVAAVPVLSDDGELTERSATVTVKYRSMVEENENA